MAGYLVSVEISIKLFVQIAFVNVIVLDSDVNKSIFSRPRPRLFMQHRMF